MERLLDQREVAGLLGLSDRTLEAWRVEGYGPAHVRVGGRCKYRPETIEAWIAGQTATSTSDPNGDGR